MYFITKTSSPHEENAKASSFTFNVYTVGFYWIALDSI